MRHQRKRLEHHADVLAPQGAQLVLGKLLDIHPIDQNLAETRLDQAIEHPYQGGFSGAGKPHDDENLTRLDVEAGIEHTDRLTGLAENLLLVGPLQDQLKCLLGFVAKYLEDMVNDDRFCHGV